MSRTRIEAAVLSSPNGLNLRRQPIRLNMIGLLVLFVGYFLTGGTGLIDSDSAKIAFRGVALIFFVTNIISEKTVRVEYIILLFTLYAALALNQSNIAKNLIFLILISMSLSKLTDRELAVTLLAPVMTVILIHLTLFKMGVLTVQITDFDGRQRSTLGFLNANQASAIYLSLVVIAYFSHTCFRTRSTLILMIASLFAASTIIDFTDSRTSIVGLLFITSFYVMGNLFENKKSYRFILRVCGALAPSIGCLSTYYITNANNTPLNILLSLRPYFFTQFIDQRTPLEFLIGWSAAGGVDNLYIMLLSGLGGIGCVFILIWSSRRIYHLNDAIIPIMISLLAVSVFEAFLVRPEIPISVLFFYMLLSRSSQRSSVCSGLRSRGVRT